MNNSNSREAIDLPETGETYVGRFHLTGDNIVSYEEGRAIRRAAEAAEAARQAAASNEALQPPTPAQKIEIIGGLMVNTLRKPKLEEDNGYTLEKAA